MHTFAKNAMTLALVSYTVVSHRRYLKSPASTQTQWMPSPRLVVLVVGWCAGIVLVVRSILFRSVHLWASARLCADTGHAPGTPPVKRLEIDSSELLRPRIGRWSSRGLRAIPRGHRHMCGDRACWGTSHVRPSGPNCFHQVRRVLWSANPKSFPQHVE